MKKLFGAILVGTMIFGAVFASASVLPVAGGTVQEGVVQASCQTNPIKVSFLTQVNGSGVNEIVSVTLSNVDPACQGKWADIALVTNYVMPIGSGTTAFNLWGLLNPTSSTTFPTIAGANHSGPPAPLSAAVLATVVQIKDAP